MVYIPSWQPKDDIKDVLIEKKKRTQKRRVRGGGWPWSKEQATSNSVQKSNNNVPINDVKKVDNADTCHSKLDEYNKQNCRLDINPNGNSKCHDLKQFLNGPTCDYQLV